MEVKRHILLKTLGWTVFILYMLSLFYFLFFSEQFGRAEISEDYRYNLVLFKEIKRYFMHYEALGPKLMFVNLLGNVFAFAPFGFCLPIISPNDNKVIRVFAASVIFSFMIETIQLIYKIGSFDVDDLLLNTFGSMIGLLIFRIVLHVVPVRGREALYVNKEEG